MIVLMGSVGAFAGVFIGLLVASTIAMLTQSFDYFGISFLLCVLIGSMAGGISGALMDRDRNTSPSDSDEGYQCSVPNCTEKHHTLSEANSCNRMYWG